MKKKKKKGCNFHIIVKNKNHKQNINYIKLAIKSVQLYNVILQDYSNVTNGMMQIGYSYLTPLCRTAIFIGIYHHVPFYL